jgi:hypothetical protein
MAFDDERAKEVIAAVDLPHLQTPIWLAEALNDAVTTYYSSFAISKTAPPHEQAEWALQLGNLADQCMRMLVPELDGSRPRMADHRVHTALFHMGEPDDFPAEPQGLAQIFGYGAVRDCLDKIPGYLWDLKRIAEHAEANWRAAMRPPAKRHVLNAARLSWIVHLADIYWRVFGRQGYLMKPTGPFARFAAMARQYAMTASPTEHGTDNEARKSMQHFTTERLASFAKTHAAALRAKLAQAADMPLVPERIRLGIINATDRG